MPVTIDSLLTVGAQESASETTAQVETTSAPGTSPADAIVTALKAQEQAALSGTATGLRLAADSAYASDPEAALSEWVQQFVSLASAQQGGGYTLSDAERNRNINVLVTSVDWTLSAGAPYEVSWTVAAQRGDGVFETDTRTPTTQSPNAQATLGGTDLGSILEKRTEIQLDVDAMPIAYGDLGETVVTPNGGAIRQVRLSGRVGGTSAELETFEETLRGLEGGNQNPTFQTAFPGTSHDVVVDSFDSTRAAGQPSTLRYDLALIEGLAL